MQFIPQDIIIAPVITERSMSSLEQKKYTFRVDRRANKIEIRKAIEAMWDVRVEKVNTMNVRGQMRRQGRTSGYTARWKKAIVTLHPDSKLKTIPLFDGMI